MTTRAAANYHEKLPILTADSLAGFLNRLETSDRFEVLLEFERCSEQQK